MAAASGRRGGTVLVWITEALDIIMAQQVARAMGGACGLDLERCFAVMVEISEQGRILLEGPQRAGLLVLRAHAERGRFVLSVHPVDLTRLDAEGAAGSLQAAAS